MKKPKKKPFSFRRCFKKIEDKIRTWKRVSWIQETFRSHKYHPLYKKNGYWHFWNETWSDLIGPYETQDEARIAFKKYCKELNPW